MVDEDVSPADLGKEGGRVPVRERSARDRLPAGLLEVGPLELRELAQGA